jgi:hypothetical protein
VFVYFAQPPPLQRTNTPTLVLPTRGLERAASAVSLRAAAKALRDRIDAWVDAIREAASG